MKFIRVALGQEDEMMLNLNHVCVVKLTSTHAYIQIKDIADRVMITLQEWERIVVFFPQKQFPRITESSTSDYLVNLENVSHIHVTSGFSYMYVMGLKDRIMLKPEVWADISVLFPPQ